MPNTRATKANRKRWQRAIIRHLESFPRQHAALVNTMTAFGDDFDLKVFKKALNDEDDLDAYNAVQSVERALGRVQNFVAELAVNGVLLAQLPLPIAGRPNYPSTRRES